MKNLLYKELRLALHPSNIIFLFFAAMVFIPGYPYGVPAFFSCLGVHFLCVNGRETHDIFYTAILPVRKRDTVLARFLLVMLFQLGQLVLMLPLMVIKDLVMPLDNPAGMEANLALVGICLILLGVFNRLFFTQYYKNPAKIGGPFLVSMVAVFVLIGVETACTQVVPLFRDKLDTRGLLFMPEKLAVLVVGLAVYALLTLIAYRKSVRSFEKLDL